MWLWGSILGMFVGASMHGWTGALWGAVIGWLAGMWLMRQGSSAAETLKARTLEARLLETQKSIAELQQRLARIEQGAANVPDAQCKPSVNAAIQVKPTIDQTPEVLPEMVAPAPPASPDNSPSHSAARTATPAAGHTSAASVAASVPAAMRENSSATEPESVARAAPAAGSAMPLPASATPALPPPQSSTTVRPPPVHATETSTAPAPSHSAPGLIERLLEGNIVAKLGVIILFFGVGFLLKFAYDRGMFPPEMRLFAVAAASVVMFAIGFRLLEKERTYSLVMMGGAMGLLYLDVFFALKSFAIIGAPLGFLLFAVLGIATLSLAVKLDARAFAVLGLTGAFLAPILASTGGGNHILLFSYYLLLNLVVLAASWFKSWRELNFIGFLFTFAAALMWGNSTYRPEHFATVEPFLIAFFLLYLAIPILFAQRQPPELKGIVDGTLVFGMPLTAAMLQAALTRDMGDAILGWSAFAAALVYAGLAWALWRRPMMRLLAEAHLALAIVFGTAAPYFAFDGYPTFAFWALEGSAIYWMGCRQKSVLARAFALLLQVAAAGYFWWVTDGLTLEPGANAWWNDCVIGCALIAAAAMLTAWFMHRFRADVSATETALEGWTIAWAGAWLLLGLAVGVFTEWTGQSTRLSALLIVMAIGLAVFEALGAQLGWRLLRLTSRAHLPLIGVITLLWLVLLPRSHPLAGLGTVAWPLTFAVYFLVLHRQRGTATGEGVEASHGWRYALAGLLMLAIATWEALWRDDHREFGWVWAIGAAGLAAAGLRHRLHGQQAGMRAAVFANLPLWWALAWWFAGVHGLIESNTADQHHVALEIAAAAVSIGLFEAAGTWLVWPALRRVQVALSLAMLLAALYLLGQDVNPLRGAQVLSWLAAFVIGGNVLWRQERASVALLPAIQPVFLFGLALWLLASESVWQAERASLALSWQFAGVAFTLALGLAAATLGIKTGRWPFALHAEVFNAWAVRPLLLLALLWTLAANVSSDGSAAPLMYLPVFNPLDLAQIALLAAAVWAFIGDRDQEQGDVASRDARLVLTLVFTAAGFFWLNAGLLRAVHHWAEVPFNLHALLRSVVAQSALSLLWTSAALVVMFAAVKRGLRPWWMVGAALLGLTVLKLFVNDLGNTGTVARIVSFIGVGVLLLVIGYVAPVPPKRARIEAGESPTSP